MKHAVDPHLSFRQLVSDRLDGVLTHDATIRLRAHLASCPRCRMAERAYLRNRRTLRSLRSLSPPRDLWARTAAALDREIARDPQRSRRIRVDRRARRADSPALMLSALASLVLGVAVVGTQFDSTADDPQTPEGPAAALPTPFEIPTQALAFVELTPEGLAIYQTTVDRVCPPAAIDCAAVSTTHRRLVAAPGELTAVSLDLHEANGRLALLTIDDLGNDTVSVVTLSRIVDPVPPFVGPLRSDGPIGPPTSPVPSAGVPSVATLAPGTLPASPGLTSPAATRQVDEGTDPLASDDPSGAAASPDEDSLTPGGSGGPSADPDPGHSSGASADPSDPGTGAPSSDVPAAVQAVLEDVRVVGAPPAWSSDGQMLAFSAMPADASGGPDVYTWRTGDTQAQRLTDDGASYFASWSGLRAVVSRPEIFVPSAVRAVTVVIDPATGLERFVEGDGGWLPAIDPSGRFAITWHGELQTDGQEVVPMHGALSMIEWRGIDPFAPTSRSPGEGTAGQGGGWLVTGAPDTGAGAISETPDASAEPPRTESRRAEASEKKRQARQAAEGSPATEPTSSPAASPGTSPEASPGTSPAASPESSPEASPNASPDTSQYAGQRPADHSPPATTDGRRYREPVEPQRDVSSDPVREWQVRWSADSTAFGYWVTETPGADWGQLAVLSIDRSSASIDEETVLLAPTLARRSFTLGRDRVAWVAPSEDGPQGELRLRTWGPRGYGSLRLRGFDVSTGLPAF